MTDKDKTEVIATMGEYFIVREYTCAFGEYGIDCVKLYRNSEQLSWGYYQTWVDNPSIEFYMKAYIDERYKQYKAKFEQVEELIKQAQFIEEDILDVSNTLDYYRGFKKEE